MPGPRWKPVDWSAREREEKARQEARDQYYTELMEQAPALVTAYVEAIKLSQMFRRVYRDRVLDVPAGPVKRKNFIDGATDAGRYMMREIRPLLIEAMGLDNPYYPYCPDWREIEKRLSERARAEVLGEESK